MEAEDTPNYINHIALVLDASASMRRVASALVEVADAEIAHLARRSRELDQETRVTVYTFNDTVRCVVYDKDVLRLPSIAGLYRPDGMTALVDATLMSQYDLEKTGQLYGDHAFLTYVMTDGQENASTLYGSPSRGPHVLSRKLESQRDNWTVACLVPDQRGVYEAKKFGFPAENVAVWDATTRAGVEEAVGTTIRTATEGFMAGRARGVRGSRTLFTAGADVINRETVAAARATGGLVPLGRSTYRLLDVHENCAIRPFVENVVGRTYVTGTAFYQLMKPEKIQLYKAVCVRDRRSGRVYGGPQARGLLGLPDHEVRVRPDHNPLYEIFVQSTSRNRKLVYGTRLLLLDDAAMGTVTV